MEALVLVFLALVLSVVGVIINGYVLCQLWGWFVVSTFHLAPLSIPVAIGLSLTVSYITHQDMSDLQKKDSSAESALGQSIGAIFLRPLLALAIGAVVHSFM